jgi:hypothetical protein
LEEIAAAVFDAPVALGTIANLEQHVDRGLKQGQFRGLM